MSVNPILSGSSKPIIFDSRYSDGSITSDSSNSSVQTPISPIMVQEGIDKTLSDISTGQASPYSPIAISSISALDPRKLGSTNPSIPHSHGSGSAPGVIDRTDITYGTRRMPYDGTNSTTPGTQQADRTNNLSAPGPSSERSSSTGANNSPSNKDKTNSGRVSSDGVGVYNASCGSKTFTTNTPSGSSYDPSYIYSLSSSSTTPMANLRLRGGGPMANPDDGGIEEAKSSATGGGIGEIRVEGEEDSDSEEETEEDLQLKQRLADAKAKKEEDDANLEESERIAKEAEAKISENLSAEAELEEMERTYLEDLQREEDLEKERVRLEEEAKKEAERLRMLEAETARQNAKILELLEQMQEMKAKQAQQAEAARVKEAQLQALLDEARRREKEKELQSAERKRKREEKRLEALATLDKESALAAERARKVEDQKALALAVQAKAKADTDKIEARKKQLMEQKAQLDKQKLLRASGLATSTVVKSELVSKENDQRYSANLASIIPYLGDTGSGVKRDRFSEDSADVARKRRVEAKSNSPERLEWPRQEDAQEVREQPEFDQQEDHQGERVQQSIEPATEQSSLEPVTLLNSTYAQLLQSVEGNRGEKESRDLAANRENNRLIMEGRVARDKKEKAEQERVERERTAQRVREISAKEEKEKEQRSQAKDDEKKARKNVAAHVVEAAQLTNPVRHRPSSERISRRTAAAESEDDWDDTERDKAHRMLAQKERESVRKDAKSYKKLLGEQEEEDQVPFVREEVIIRNEDERILYEEILKFDNRDQGTIPIIFRVEDDRHVPSPVSELSSEVGGERIVDRDIFKLVEMKKIGRHPRDKHSLNQEGRTRRDHIKGLENDACNKYWKEVKDHPVISTEAFKDAHGAWTAWQSCLYNFSDKLTDSEFAKMIEMQQYWLRQMIEIEARFIVTPRFTEHKLQLNRPTKTLLTKSSVGNPEPPDSGDESSGSDESDDPRVSKKEPDGRKEKKSESGDDSETGSEGEAPKLMPQSLKSKVARDPVIKTSKAPTGPVSQAAPKKERKRREGSLPPGIPSTLAIVSPPMCYYEEDLIDCLKAHFSKSCGLPSQPAANMLRIASPMEDNVLLLQATVAEAEQLRGDCRLWCNIEDKSYGVPERSATMFNDQASIRQLCLDLIFIIKLVLQWGRVQSEMFSEQLKCVIEHLEDEPGRPQILHEDAQFPSLERTEIALSPISQQLQIYTLKQIMEFTSEYKRPDFLGTRFLDYENTRGPMLNAQSPAVEEINIGTEILGSYLVMEDWRLRYMRDLQVMWFDAYKNSKSTTVVMKHEAVKNIKSPVDGPPEEGEEPRMRRGTRSHPYAVFGAPFRYQDSLPYINIPELNAMFEDEHYRSIQSEEHRVQYEELRTLVSSTFFREFIKLSPTLCSVEVDSRSPLQQQILILRSVHHCHKIKEILKCILNIVGDQIDEVVITEVKNLQKDILQRDKEVAEKVWSYRTGLNAFYNLRDSLEKAIDEDTFVPILRLARTSGPTRTWQESAKMRIDMLHDVQQVNFNGYGRSLPLPSYVRTRRLLRMKFNTPVTAPTRQGKSKGKTAESSTMSSTYTISKKNAEGMFVIRMKGKKSCLVLVSPDSISEQHGETYDMIRRRENLMYGYSRSEMHALMEEITIRQGADEDLDEHMWAVYEYLQDQCDRMAKHDKEEINSRGFRYSRLAILEGSYMHDPYVEPNSEWNELLEELRQERKRAGRKLNIVERNQNSESVSSKCKPAKIKLLGRDGEDEDDEYVGIGSPKSKSSRRIQLDKESQSSSEKSKAKSASQSSKATSSQGKTSTKGSSSELGTDSDDTQEEPEKDKRQKSNVPKNMKASAVPIDLTESSREEDQDPDESGGIVEVHRSSSRQPRKEEDADVKRVREELHALNLTIEISKATYEKDQEVRRLRTCLERQALEMTNILERQAQEMAKVNQDCEENARKMAKVNQECEENARKIRELDRAEAMLNEQKRVQEEQVRLAREEDEKRRLHVERWQAADQKRRDDMFEEDRRQRQESNARRLEEEESFKRVVAKDLEERAAAISAREEERALEIKAREEAFRVSVEVENAAKDRKRIEDENRRRSEKSVKTNLRQQPLTSSNRQKPPSPSTSTVSSLSSMRLVGGGPSSGDSNRTSDAAESLYHSEGEKKGSSSSGGEGKKGPREERLMVVVKKEPKENSQSDSESGYGANNSSSDTDGEESKRSSKFSIIPKNVRPRLKKENKKEVINQSDTMAKVLGEAIVASNLALAASNEANSKFLVESIQAIQLSVQEGKSQLVKKKVADPTLVMNILPEEIWLRGLQSLPSNHSRSGISTDITQLPVYDGTQVIVSVINKIFEFCVSRSLNHQSLLAFIEGLQIFSEGIKLRVRPWILELNTSQFILDDDKEDDKGLPPQVTRMLIHCVRKLCKDFYVKPKQSALQMLNTMDAIDFQSYDEKGRPSFLHLDNVLPFVNSLLITAEPWNRTDEVIVTTVEGIIRRSGNLMRQYSTMMDTGYQWAALQPLAKCTAVLEYLSNQAKESLTSEFNCNLPKYTPPTYSSNINGYMRNSVRIVEDHLKKAAKKERHSERAEKYERDKRGELIKTNAGAVSGSQEGSFKDSQPEYTIETTSFSISVVDNYSPISGFFSENTPTIEEVEEFVDDATEVGIVNSVSMEGSRGGGLAEEVCSLCGCEYHLEGKCCMTHKWAEKNPKKNPLCIWKYAGLKNEALRAMMLNHAHTRGFFSHPDHEKYFENFTAAVQKAVESDQRAKEQKQLDWAARNPDKHRAQEAEKAEKSRMKQSFDKKDGSRYSPSSRRD